LTRAGGVKREVKGGRQKHEAETLKGEWRPYLGRNHFGKGGESARGPLVLVPRAGMGRRLKNGWERGKKPEIVVGITGKRKKREKKKEGGKCQCEKTKSRSGPE